MIDKTPNQLKLPFYLWTRKAIKAAVYMLWKIDIPLRTISEYMKRLGFFSSKTIKKKLMNRILKKLKNGLKKIIQISKRRLKNKRQKYTGLMKQV